LERGRSGRKEEALAESQTIEQRYIVLLEGERKRGYNELLTELQKNTSSL
jgi:hypothetical protein